MEQILSTTRICPDDGMTYNQRDDVDYVEHHEYPIKTIGREQTVIAAAMISYPKYIVPSPRGECKIRVGPQNMGKARATYHLEA